MWSNAAREWGKSLLGADRCCALVGSASVTSILPSHCSHHHWQPDAMSTVNNCCCFSPRLHKLHGGGMTVCVCKESQFGWGTVCVTACGRAWLSHDITPWPRVYICLLLASHFPQVAHLLKTFTNPTAANAAPALHLLFPSHPNTCTMTQQVCLQLRQLYV